MRIALTASLLAAVASLLCACGPEPQPLRGSVSFTACVGRAGTCSNNCCAYSDTRVIADDPRRLDCKIYSGSREGELRVDFEIVSSDNRTGLSGDNLTFDNNESSPVVVRACDGFTVKEDGNEYPARYNDAWFCSNSEPRTETPVGGGCDVEMHLDADDVIVGRFRCQELQLPAQDLYFSTVHSGTVGWGEFRFENCADRR